MWDSFQHLIQWQLFLEHYHWNDTNALHILLLSEITPGSHGAKKGQRKH